MRRVFIPGAVLVMAIAAMTLTHAQNPAGGPAAPQGQGAAGQARPQGAPPQLPKMRSGVGYYTAAQAERGKPKFEKECSDCHTVDPKKQPRVPYGGSLVTG